MSGFARHDPAEPLAAGRTIIEASAGTGKTYTIAAEVTRLVALEGIDLGEILVVTFTRAATAELKSRVRDRMRSTLHLLEAREPKGDPAGDLDDDMDGYFQALLAVDPATKAAAARRLAVALAHFDDAQIFTIHGFAQRLLAQLGFRSRIPPDLEPGATDQQLLTQVASDALVARFAHNPSGDEEPKLAQLEQIGLAVVGTPDARIVPAADTVDGIARTRVEMAHVIKQEMARRLRAAGLVTFDDGLVEARDALADGDIGEGAREILRRSYAVALVDEAQDTDPMQWQIIRSVFDDARLIVVGDPKQSIYSFRSADVESYLAAVEGADEVRTLGTNWRSDGALLTALDTLFTGATFGDDRIGYRPVDPAPGHVVARLDGPGSPLTIHRFGDDIDIGRRKDGYFYIDDARDVVAGDVGSEIVQLLTVGAMIRDGELRRLVGPADIAVLCRTRRQVDSIRRELAARNVPSVTSRTGGVYLSEVAQDWWRFLLAVERPDRADFVRLAATTLLVGHRADEVASFDDAEVIDLQDRVAGWQTILSNVGVPALVADIHRTTGFAARALALADGERLMTDFAHIAEEMHGVWRRNRTGSLASWLENAMAESAQLAEGNVEESESRQRRLETDADAVQVQTVHGAKGLEYGVVFVPFAWDTTPRRPTVPVFHDPQETVGDVPRRRLVDVGGSSDEFNEHVAIAMAEAEAEEGRLLYVALTRAKHRLHVWWIEEAQPTAGSKLTELIDHDDRGIEGLVEAGGGTIAVTVLDDAPIVERYEHSASSDAALDRALFERPLDHTWQRSSFTSLSSEHPLTSVETSEQPLREDEETVAVNADEEPIPPTSAVAMPLAELPRGARFGTLVHEVFEHVTFDAPDLGAAVRVELQRAAQYSVWDFDHEPFVAGIVAALQTPLGPSDADPRLCDLDPTRLLDEMRFDLPIRTNDAAIQLGDIADVFDRHLAEDDPVRRFADHLRNFTPRRFRGYLSGAIDLVAELPTTQGPRFVIVDYKSNALAMLGEKPSPADYGPGPLSSVMASSNYVLQATLYQVALHRYLQWRLPGYDPAVHLGGSMYLFVRGMVGGDTPVIDGERCGVARWHPPASFVVAVSELFKGGRP